jgi:hypothetical protein
MDAKALIFTGDQWARKDVPVFLFQGIPGMESYKNTL